MEFAIGSMLALAVTGSAAALGFDRDRAFYPTILMVIASYYVLFAAVGAGSRVVIVESVVAGAFLLVAVIGFKTSLSLVAAALVGHAVFDACITSLSRTQGCRVGGRAFVSRSMSSLAASWLCR